MLLDERDGETMKAAQLAYGCFEFLHNHRRQPFKRLVEQKQVGIGHQRPTNREQLLLAARKLVTHVAAPALFSSPVQ